jgi:hypothetical protein
VALSFVGVSGREERQQAEDVMEQSREQWPTAWLRRRGLRDWAAYYEENFVHDTRRIA